MKTSLLVATSFLLSAVCLAQKNIPTIRATGNQCSIRVGNQFLKNAWTISPELKPDIFEIPIGPRDEKIVAFITDMDSISVAIVEGMRFRFNILYNGDTAVTELLGIKGRVNFTDQYIKAHQDRAFVNLPEVQELVFVAMALTETGREDKNMINHNGAYYQDVLSYFDSYAKHPAVLKIDSLLKQEYYYALATNGCAFQFNSDGKIVNSGIFDYMYLIRDPANKFDKLIPVLEAFSIDSGFRRFFANHHQYYDEQIAQLEKATRMRKQWIWLEKQFAARYNSYAIYFSPLVYGSHCTLRFEDNNFKEIAMFICGTDMPNLENCSSKVIEGLMTRIIFTEIDHNYVNPTSDHHQSEIKAALKHLDHWATPGALTGYSNAYSVFNEYATWGVFTMYAYDNFSSRDFEIINKKTEQLMASGRGFKRFSEFNSFVLDLYKNRKRGQKVPDLYPDILKWFSEN